MRVNGFSLREDLPYLVEYSQNPGGMLPRDFEPKVILRGEKKGEEWQLWEVTLDTLGSTSKNHIGTAYGRSDAHVQLREYARRMY